MTQVILWRRIDLPGHELARLDTLDDGWKLSGTAVFSSQQGPTRLDYAVICDSAWWTQSAQVNGTIGPHSVDIAVSVSRERTWHLNRVECREVQGCVDIDLGFSPSTNLLPIRRLALAVGEEAEVRAAWLPFPSLRFEPLSQLYRREEERTWRYESGGGAFVRTLAVNATGFVTSYPEIWEAEAMQPPSRRKRFRLR
jgi:hypothetical protein